jgi:hypothetical protein
MTYFEKFVKFFNEFELDLSDSKETHSYKELELKLLLDSRNKVPNFIKQLDLKDSILVSKSILSNLLQNTSDKDQTISQTINFISTGENYSSLIKELHFINGVQDKEKKHIYKKESVHTPIYLCGSNKYDFKLSFNIETDLKEDPVDFEIIRFKYRFSFKIDNWKVDITFIKTSTSKEISSIREIKDKFFASCVTKENILTEDWFWQYADRIEIEFEFDNMSEFKTTYIKNIYDIITLSTNIKDFGKDILHKLYCLINNASSQTMRKNSIKNTLKKILPNAIEINKKQYFTEILPEINRFYLTDKADGIRTILLMDADKISYYNTSYNVIEENPQFSYKETIIECEKVGDLFYAYDIIQYDGVCVAQATFEKRLDYLKRIKWVNLRIKKFVKLTKENYQVKIKEFYEESLQNTYNIDGLIFTSYDSSYRSTRFYKWKPVHDMTIDFIARKCPKELAGISPYDIKPGFTIYLLFSGISSKEFKKLNMTKVQYYNKLFSYTDKYYFPVQFSPSDYPNAYIWYCPDNIGDIDNKIVELNFNGEWRLNKIRNDRSDDFEKKQYYGNNFKVAEIIWRNYSNPLTLDLVCSSYDKLSSDFYFITEHSATHETIRKFNNMVKFSLINRFSIKDSWLIDLGCGKGQDMFKYIKSGVGNTLFIDVNENNLCDIITRKYSYCENKAFDKNAMGIYIQNLDLTKNYLENLEKLSQLGMPIVKNTTKLIVCNFAIHYLIDDARQITNLVNMVNALLSTGGRFIFTCMNGSKIFDLFQDNATEWGDGLKYKIKKLYNQSKFTGLQQKIDILLPFSNGGFYTESLVNLDLLEKNFLKKKIKLESQDSFEMYLDTFEQTQPRLYNNLDELDKEYIKLLSFSVYYKS